MRTDDLTHLTSSGGDAIVRPSTTPWWLWLNLLSLDAPLVAIAWQLLLAWAFDVALEPAAVGALATAVWLVYAGDRWLDSFHVPLSQTPRHQFYYRHRLTVLLLLAVAAPVGLTMALTALSWMEIAAGLAFAGIVLGYLLAVHGKPKLTRKAKPLLVALIFGAGCGLLPLLRTTVLSPAELGLIAAFAAACWLNCELVATWEHDTSESTEPSHRISWLTGFGAGLGLAMGMIFLTWGDRLGPVALVISAAAWMLAFLAGWRQGNHDLKTALADMALFMPAACAILATEVIS